MATGNYFLGLVAGMLSILSPCVLPLLPVVFGTAAGKHRAGPVALAAGLTLSFVATGLFIATVGHRIGFDGAWIRPAAGVLLIALGLVLLVPVLGARVAVAAGPAGAWLDQRFAPVGDGRGLSGQFATGVLLGAVWSPCVGPTLGAAALLASRGENLAQVALTMTAFGFGAAISLTIIGLLSRTALARWRTRMARAGHSGKMAFGAILLIVGFLVASGLDKRLETWLVDISPDWLTRLTTSI